MTLTCSINIYVHHTSRLHKDAEEVEQNDWTTWPDHSKKQKEMREHINSMLIMLPLPYILSIPV